MFVDQSEGLSYRDSFTIINLEMGKWYLLILGKNEMSLSNLQKFFILDQDLYIDHCNL